MIVIDASIWVSFLVQQDLNYPKTHLWLTNIITSRVPIVAPVLLLSEVGGAIARRLNQPALGNKAVNQILSIPTLHLIAIDHPLGIKTGKLAASYKLRGADAVYVSLASELNLPLLSWDKEKISRASQIIKTYTPDNAPSISI